MAPSTEPSVDCSVPSALLAGYGDSELHAAGLRGRSLAYRRNDKIVLSGETRDNAWIVRAGWVRVLLPSDDAESTAEILGPGDLFGCPGCSGRAYTCTVVALTAVSVTAYNAKNLEKFLHSHPAAVCRLSSILGRRVREVAFLKTVNSERSSLRVPLVLGWLRGKFGDDMPVSRGLLADICGLRRETCSRSLSRLKRRGVLTLASGRIRILRPAALGSGPR